jgi:hypothetical protein
MAWLLWSKVMLKLLIQGKYQISNLHGSRSMKTRGLSRTLKQSKNTNRFFKDSFKMINQKESSCIGYCPNSRSRLFDSFKSIAITIKTNNTVKNYRSWYRKNRNQLLKATIMPTKLKILRFFRGMLKIYAPKFRLITIRIKIIKNN